MPMAGGWGGKNRERNAMKPMREERRKLISTKKRRMEKGYNRHGRTTIYSLSWWISKKKFVSTSVVSQKYLFLSYSTFFWPKNSIFANSKSLFPLLERARALDSPPPRFCRLIHHWRRQPPQKKKKRRVWAQKSGKLEQEKRFFKSIKFTNLGQVSSKLAFFWYSVFQALERGRFFKMKRKKKGLVGG